MGGDNNNVAYSLVKTLVGAYHGSTDWLIGIWNLDLFVQVDLMKKC